MTWHTRALSGLSQLVLRSASVILSRIPLFNWILRRFIFSVNLGGKNKRTPLPGAWDIPGATKKSFSGSVSKREALTTKRNHLPTFSHLVGTSSTAPAGPPRPAKKLSVLTQFIIRSFVTRKQNAAQASKDSSLVTDSNFAANVEAKPSAPQEQNGIMPANPRNEAEVNSGVFVNVTTQVEAKSRTESWKGSKTVLQGCKETPETWTRISRPLTVSEKVTDPEWQIPKKRNCARVKTIMAALEKNTGISNPFLALANIGDDDFQRPQYVRCKNTPTRILGEMFLKNYQPLPILSPPLEESGKFNTDPASSLILEPGKNLTLDTYTTLNPSLSSTETKIQTHEDLEIARLIKNRRRKNGLSSCPAQSFKKVPHLAPWKDSPDALRQASSPPRSPSPTRKIPENEWRVQRKRNRRHSVETHAVELVPNLTATDFSLRAMDSIELMKISPQVATLYKVRGDNFAV